MALVVLYPVIQKMFYGLFAEVFFHFLIAFETRQNIANQNSFSFMDIQIKNIEDI
jgi:hypothetical protein